MRSGMAEKEYVPDGPQDRPGWAEHDDEQGDE